MTPLKLVGKNINNINPVVMQASGRVLRVVRSRALKRTTGKVVTSSLNRITPANNHLEFESDNTPSQSKPTNPVGSKTQTQANPRPQANTKPKPVGQKQKANKKAPRISKTPRSDEAKLGSGAGKALKRSDESSGAGKKTGGCKPCQANKLKRQQKYRKR